MVQFAAETIGPELILVNGSCARPMWLVRICETNRAANNGEPKVEHVNSVFIFTGKPTPKQKPYSRWSQVGRDALIAPPFPCKPTSQCFRCEPGALRTARPTFASWMALRALR